MADNPFADDIKRMYIDEGITDQLIADALPVTVTADTVRDYRIRRLRIASTRHKKVGRFLMEARYEAVKHQLPAVWERSKRWYSTQKRMVGSAERVGQEFGVSMATARKWLARQGLVEKRIDGKEGTQQALELFNEGWSVPRIAKKLGASEESVRSWLHAQGCDLSNYTDRMSYEEKIAWLRSISEGKVGSVAGSGRYSYEGTRLDSPRRLSSPRTATGSGCAGSPTTARRWTSARF
jgi:transposase